jgi:hypothetical protein
VKLYLEDLREKGGEEAVQNHWNRIWKGYVTWATIGTFGADLLQHLLLFDGKLPGQLKAYAAQRMVAMITRKAPTARKSHGAARLGGRPLNELFEKPTELMDALLADPEGWIDQNNPRDSRFFRELISFSGPMYKVFTPEDQDIILDWIESLRDVPTPPPSHDVGQQIKKILLQYADRARREPRHNAFTFPQSDGTPKAIREWFEGPLEELMAALARSEWIKPGAVADSSFFTDVVGSDGLMAEIIRAEDIDVIKDWVGQGCPQPGEVPSPSLALSRTSIFAAPLPSVPFFLKRQTIGHGSVHLVRIGRLCMQRAYNRSRNCHQSDQWICRI